MAGMMPNGPVRYPSRRAGQHGDAFGRRDRAEHPAAAGILGVLLEECQQARHGRRTGQAGDDDTRQGGPDRHVAKRVREDGRAGQAGRDRAVAERARGAGPLAGTPC
jgi:hypothetical protein